MSRIAAQITGDIGELAVESMLVRFGWTPNRLHRDEGIDYLVHGEPRAISSSEGYVDLTGKLATVKEVESSRLPYVSVRPMFLAQVKTLGTSQRKKQSVLRLSTRHLIDWERIPLPMLVFVVDANTEEMAVIDIRALIVELDACGDSWRGQVTKSIQLPQFRLVDKARWIEICSLVYQCCEDLNARLIQRPTVLNMKRRRPFYNASRTGRTYKSAADAYFEEVVRPHAFRTWFEGTFPEASSQAWAYLYWMNWSLVIGKKQKEKTLRLAPSAHALHIRMRRPRRGDY